ncbi:Filamentous hemagglutinin family outer membrane protein [Candidatus Magnetomorum sp. HK-1]|nr:Filamentous hemagglutinin family outer membrane protein [Candidatus Magnetomorum sp. HK-1]
MNTSYINAVQYTSEGKTVEGFAGGSIDIHVKQLSMLDGSAILIETYCTKNSGDISIHAENILIKGNYNDIFSNISTSSISIDVNNSLKIQQKPGIFITKEQTFGDAGNINIYTGNFVLSEGASIKANALSRGNGGNLSILSRYTILNKSQIIANAYEGNGGNIDITADYLIQSSDSVISASSQLGIDGNITIDAFTENFDKQIISIINEIFIL